MSDPTRLPDVTVDASGNLVEVPDDETTARLRRVRELTRELVRPSASPVPLSVADYTMLGYDLETSRKMSASWAAKTLARVARRQAPFAYLIRVGSEVKVDTGRRVPYGFYRVLRHYNTSLHHGNARVDLVASDTWRKCGYRVEKGEVVGRTRPDKFPAVTCAVANVKPVPDWSYPFRDWGPWAVLGGVALTGFDGTAWSMLADLIEDWDEIPPLTVPFPGDPEVFPRDYPPSYLAAELRDTIGHPVTGRRAFQGPVYVTPEVSRANENPT